MSGHRSLTTGAVRYIRRCYKLRMKVPSAKELADRFEVSLPVVRSVERNRRYRDVR